MGYIFTLGDMHNYIKWSRQPGPARLMHAGASLCHQMLSPQPQEEILDIGCGSCFSLLKLREKGFMVHGIEASSDIVALAERQHGLGECLDVGDACDLPYDDNSFSYACFFNALEYIENPQQALAEAFRVTRQKVFIGFFNRYAVTCFRHRIQGLWSKSFFQKANFFSLWDIKNMVHKTLGPVPVQWRSLPLMALGETSASPLSQHIPFCGFIGLTVTVNPRFTTNALHLKCEFSPFI